ncbi:MAG: DUF1156 domain-containing protein, partial [Nitrososphaerota archaeon]
MEDKRLIEVDFPLKDVSQDSIKEKYIREHIATLHPWWARRPLAASRTTIYAALVPIPKNQEELRKKLEFITKLSKWESALNREIIEQAKKDIKGFFGNRIPTILDCFAGGGSIPLEALRLGCETYALEYNPVAVLILKATLEYPQKYGNKLIEDIKKWGQWVYEEAKKELGEFYPEKRILTQGVLLGEGEEKYIPMGYIWARTIKCQNPSCQVEIPLIKQFYLVKGQNKRIALKIITNKEKRLINFEIVKDNEINFNPSVGTVKRGTVLCPICETGHDHKILQKLAQERKMGYRLVGVILDSPQKKGKIYCIAEEDDLRIYKQACHFLEEKIKKWPWDFDPLPKECMNTRDPTTVAGRGYGFEKWEELFNARQKLALITFVEKVRNAYTRMLKKSYDEEYAKAVTVYLSLAVSRMANRMSTFTYWYAQGEKIQPTFVRQALPMIWDFIELNPFNISSGGWQMNIF